MSESLVNDIEAAPNLESKGDVVILWRKYRFPGKPPDANTPVLTRLRETCARYAKMMVFPERTSQPTPILANHKRMFGGGEDYFAERREHQAMTDLMSGKEPLKRIIPSDAAKRELHNQIALMVVGRTRSGMDEASAEHIADFACELTYNKSIKEMDRLKTSGELV